MDRPRRFFPDRPRQRHDGDKPCGQQKRKGASRRAGIGFVQQERQQIGIDRIFPSGAPGLACFQKNEQQDRRNEGKEPFRAQKVEILQDRFHQPCASTGLSADCREKRVATQLVTSG